MEDIIDKELLQKLEEINKKMDEALQTTSSNIIQKIETTKQQIKKRINEKKNFYKNINEYRDTPNIQIIPISDSILNNLINPTLFVLANLETITEFSLEITNERKELMKHLKGVNNHFLPIFINLMKNMRSKKVVNPDYQYLHQYLIRKVNNYMGQSPSSIIKCIFQLIVYEINLANNYLPNKYPNIIENDFLVTLKTKKNCKNCGITVEIVEENKYIIDLFLKPEISGDKSLQSIFLKALSGIENNNEKCKYCGNIMSYTKSIGVSKKYLILNIKSIKEPQNLMRLKISDPLIITEEKFNCENKYTYELISVFADLNPNTLNLTDAQILNINEINKNNLKILCKNFINDKWYRIINGKIEEFKGNIKEEINNYKSNALIYKRI